MHKDVFMRSFCQSLPGEARLWLRNLEADSIGSWVDFYDVFLRYWGERKFFSQYLYEFYAMKRRKDETVTKFNRRFHSFYLNMPKDIQPSEIVARLFYTTTHHPDIAFYLRERKSLTLQQMFTNAEEIEDNLQACGKLQNHTWDGDLDAE
jgi:hypothetical protein